MKIPPNDQKNYEYRWLHSKRYAKIFTHVHINESAKNIFRYHGDCREIKDNAEIIVTGKRGVYSASCRQL